MDRAFWVAVMQAAAFASGSKYNELEKAELLPPRAIPTRRPDKKPAPKRIQRRVSFAASWTSELSDRFAPSPYITGNVYGLLHSARNGPSLSAQGCCC